MFVNEWRFEFKQLVHYEQFIHIIDRSTIFLLRHAETEMLRRWCIMFNGDYTFALGMVCVFSKCFSSKCLPWNRGTPRILVWRFLFCMKWAVNPRKPRMLASLHMSMVIEMCSASLSMVFRFSCSLFDSWLMTFCTALLKWTTYPHVFPSQQQTSNVERIHLASYWLSCPCPSPRYR